MSEVIRSHPQVKTNSFVLNTIIIATLALLIIRCATPTQPSGGEPDTTGPSIIETQPEDGTVNFDGDEIIFEFDDYIDRGSFEQAFSIQPELGIEYDVSWSRRTATVSLETELPDTTTIVFGLSTDLTDMNNNAMESSFQLAISTGPDIDEGEITGFIIDGNDGTGMEQERVLLYRLPYDIETAADYIAEADEDGSFSFQYLREGTYKAFWVDDRNRNRTWDPPREAAQPFSKETVDLEAGGSEDFGTLFIQQVDSIPPELIGVGLYNPERLRLRFDEGIEISDTTDITVTNEDGDPLHSAMPLYVEPGNQSVMFARSENPLDPDENHLLDLHDIYDSEGNPAIFAADPFSGSDEPDTTLQRLIRHDTQHGIREDEPLRFRFADAIDPEQDSHRMIQDSLDVVVTDTAITGWEHTEIDRNFLYVYPDQQWQEAESYTIRLWNPGRMARRDFDPVIWYEDDLGELELIVEEPSSEDAVHEFEVINEEGQRVKRGNFHESTILEGLAPGQYTVKVYEDENRDGRWQAGSVEPFRPPEPYYVESEITVESGLTGQVMIELDKPADITDVPEEQPEAPDEIPDTDAPPDP